MEKDSSYFSRRASEETTAATGASHPNARKAHLEMAQKYQEMADAIAAHDPSLKAEPTDRNQDLPLSA